jgi:hypothetical protein
MVGGFPVQLQRKTETMSNTKRFYPITESVPVRLLQVGDIVVAGDGFLCEVVEAPHQSMGHSDDHNGCWATRARVTNAEALIESDPGIAGWIQDSRYPGSSEYGWTLQGNDLGKKSRIVTP